VVRLPQLKGAGGLQPTVEFAKASDTCWTRRARAEAVTAKRCGVTMKSGIDSANCSTCHRKPMTNEDAASRRKRDAGVRNG
jgi:hypothetical protein